ncbi:MAG: YkgJ family cysteine cluster protein [Vampirovibrionales bacterium]|nr:YkgJ family cysteine cluster protein [Vampirovibrionales bacterium]
MVVQSPPPQTFACNQCGQCCTSVSIPIEPEKAKALKQLDWVIERLALHGVDFEPLPKNKYDTRWQVPLTAERRCVFLGDANECLVHHFAGPELKPDECHRYPFSSGFRSSGLRQGPVMDDPVGLQYDVTASCQSVADGLSEGIVNWQPSSIPPPHPLGVDALPEEWPVVNQKSLPWGERDAWLSSLRPLIKDKSVTAWQLLQAASQIFHKSPQKSRVNSSFFERLWLILCLRKPYSLWSVAALLSGKGYVDNKVLGTTPIALASVLSQPVSDTSTALKAFVVSILSRRLPYVIGMDAQGLWWLAFSGWVLVRFYARALFLLENNTMNKTMMDNKTEGKRADVDESLVVVAIRLVERYYTGHQPRFVAWVHRRSRASAVLGRLLKVFPS